MSQVTTTWTPTTTRTVRRLVSGYEDAPGRLALVQDFVNTADLEDRIRAGPGQAAP